MTSSFRKGQLVAVKEPPATKWELRVFERTAYANAPYCKEVIVRRPENAEGEGFSVCEQFVRPAEDVWPEFFFDAADRQIEWLCSKLKGCSDAFGICPPNSNACKDPWQDCQHCWRKTSFNATQETRNE